MVSTTQLFAGWITAQNTFYSCLRYGAPVFISQPHFLNADPYYLSLVQSGLSPDPTLHGTSFKVEPLSGIPTEVVARLFLICYFLGNT